MRLLKTLCLLTASALALTACGDSTGSSDFGKLRIEAPAAALTAPCNRPVRIPVVRNQGIQETAWRRDRIALARCANRHEALTDYTLGLLAGLSNGK